jgi:hypothetical protein
MSQPRNKRLLFFGLCSEEEKMSTQDALKASAPEKAGTSRSVEMNGSGLSVESPKSNAVTVKTGILFRSRMMLFETTCLALIRLTDTGVNL